MFCVPTGKKNYQFELTVGLEELTSVPFVNGVIFAKMRLLDARNSKQYSSREPIKDHVVRWNSKHKLQCRLLENVQTNMLESSELKISIRKEIKGGKSYLKMGYVLVNISCFANLGDTACRRRYILEGYNQDKRQDNSMLQMHFTVCQRFGDPCFRVPEEDMSKCVPYEVVPSLQLLAISHSSSFEGIDGLLDSDPVDSDNTVASLVINLDSKCKTSSPLSIGTTRDTVADIYNEISRHTQIRSQDDDTSPIFFNEGELRDPSWTNGFGEPIVATIPKFSKQTVFTQNPGYSTCPHPTTHVNVSSLSLSPVIRYQACTTDNRKNDVKQHRRYGSSTQGSGSTAPRTSSSGYCSHSRQSSNESTSCIYQKSPQAGIGGFEKCDEQKEVPREQTLTTQLHSLSPSGDNI